MHSLIEATTQFPAKTITNPMKSFVSSRVLAAALLCSSACAVLTGCDTGSTSFELNMPYIYKQQIALGSPEEPYEFKEQDLQQIADILTAMFGTPDDPHVPRDDALGVDEILDMELIRTAAGPVRQGQAGTTISGLYRQHCVHCHGITGDGRGPTAAYLNPYPRDYRMGLYKFKSTEGAKKPTHHDLKTVLIRGVPGTSMPSFKLLGDQELEALVHYVKYLSIRGEVERKLVQVKMEEPDAPLPTSREFLVGEIFADVLKDWRTAPEYIPAIADRPDVPLAESIDRGRDIFFGAGGCVQCHGNTQLGDGGNKIKDLWSDELKPDEPAVIDEYLARGALPPRILAARNLRHGEYRGGRRPVDIYLRIRNGIYASQMPAIGIRRPTEPPTPTKITEQEIWHVVDYVLSLPYEDVSRPGEELPENKRLRP